MKKTLTATAVFLAMTAVASAATPIVTPSGQYLWQGELSIVAATPAALCTSNGSNVGKSVHAVFAPKGAPKNDQSQDKLMIFPLDELAAMQSAMQLVSNTSSTKGLLNNAKSVTNTGIDSRGYYTETIGGTFSVSQPTPTPTAIGNSTVTVSFTITQDGCTFTMSGKLAGPF